jgi:hypothetical protein
MGDPDADSEGSAPSVGPVDHPLQSEMPLTVVVHPLVHPIGYAGPNP